jgi:NAD(P)-dependent dehydrogenase (short-subunit alcohol dehydrogenase family)
LQWSDPGSSATDTNGVYIWPQVTSLRQKVKSIGLSNLRVEKLDLLHPYDVANALKWDIDILFSNAGIGENGPICEIPIDLVRRTFETNVFAPLELAQKFIRKWVDEKRPGKLVFTSSGAGLLSVMGFAPYCASKHALECIAESLQVELKPFNIQVQTINPGGYLTGFNETMAESAFHWQDDSKNFIKRADILKLFDASIGHEEARLDPKEMIDAMVSIVPGRCRQVPQICAKDSRGVPEGASEGSLGKPYLIQKLRKAPFRNCSALTYAPITSANGF